MPNLNFQTNRGWTAATIAPQTQPQSQGNASVIGSPINGAPGFLQDAIARLLNTQATGGGSATDALLRQILGAGASADYLTSPAITAFAAGQSGLKSLALAPVQNPLIGQGYNTLATAQAERTRAQTGAINRVQELQNQILGLQQKKGTAFNTPSFGPSFGGKPNIDNQVFDLQQQLNSAQKLATASASSGWAPMNIPGYG